MRAFCRVAPGVPKVRQSLISSLRFHHGFIVNARFCLGSAVVIVPVIIHDAAFGLIEVLLAFCVDRLPPLKQMANMLEGGGKTPVLSPKQLEDIGFKVRQDKQASLDLNRRFEHLLRIIPVFELKCLQFTPLFPLPGFSIPFPSFTLSIHYVFSSSSLWRILCHCWV